MSDDLVMSEPREAVMYIAAIRLPPGKLAAQVAHAAVQCFRDAKSNRRRYRARKIWLDNPVKIVLRLEADEQAEELVRAASIRHASVAVIRDAGRTTVEPGTLTAVAIGPVFRDEPGPWHSMRLY